MKKYILVALLLGLAIATPVLALSPLPDIDTQIANLRAQIARLTTELNQLLQQQQGGICHEFARDLKVGDGGLDGGTRGPLPIDEDVRQLREILISEGVADFVQEYGTAGGSMKTTLFSEFVHIAVKKFQAKYGIPQTGYVGPLTRGKLNQLYGCKGAFITPSTLEAAVISKPYNQHLLAHGVSKKGLITKFDIIGVLPPGLGWSQDDSRWDYCDDIGNCSPPPGIIISGVPTTSGTYNFTVQATNGTQIATQNYTLRVLAKEQTATSTITVVSPNGGEVYGIGNKIRIKWSSTNDLAQRKVNIILTQSDGNAVIDTITDQVNMTGNDGEYLWTIPRQTPPGSYRIGVQTSEKPAYIFDVSDAPFSITLN